MPLWDAYDKMLESKLADINNVGGGPYAGSITAALFLRHFVERARSWVHFDVYNWAPAAKSGRPEGGEIQASRLLYDLIEARYGRPSGVRGETQRPVHHIHAHIDEGEEEEIGVEDKSP